MSGGTVDDINAVFAVKNAVDCLVFRVAVGYGIGRHGPAVVEGAVTDKRRSGGYCQVPELPVVAESFCADQGDFFADGEILERDAVVECVAADFVDVFTAGNGLEVRAVLESSHAYFRS